MRLHHGRVLRTVYFSPKDYKDVEKAISIKQEKVGPYAKVGFSAFARIAIQKEVNKILKTKGKR